MGDRPVEQVSWNEANDFCKRLTEIAKKTYRLPSEAEWEYACRGGTTTPFHFGETIMAGYINYHGEYHGQTSRVGKYKVANAFGLYDIHGNVWEWCEDYWHNSYKNASTNGRAWIEIDGAHNKILRGGL